MGLTRLVAAAAVAACTLAAYAGESTIDYPVASVNSQMITRSQVEARRATIAKLNNVDLGAVSFDIALTAEVERALLLQAANDYVDKDTKDRVKKYSDESIKKERDPRVFDPTSESKKAADSHYDRTLLDFYLEKKLYSHITVSPAEIREYYQKNQDKYTDAPAYTMREILVRFAGTTPEDAKARAEKAFARVKAGEDFAAVAKEVSQDPYAKEGGLWPPQKNGEGIEEVQKAALALKPGEVSEPFSSPLGWNVVKLESLSAGGLRPFAKAQGDISRTLLEQAHNEARKQLLAELTRKAIVRAYPIPAQETGANASAH